MSAVPSNALVTYVGEDFTPSFCLGVRIVSSSVANPSVIVTDAAHGFRTGQTVYIVRHIGSTPAIDGTYVATVLSATSF